ncbi:DUF6069 family protein [Metabacillus indicus]|uniref:DUF6069 family protein n=1 Tax=Metabacillus indicus TaxID=246786 RepID=UPI003179344E
MSNLKQKTRFPARVYVKKAFIAAVVSSVLNAIVFGIGSLIGAIPEGTVISGSSQPFSVAQVIFASAVGSILGILVFWMIGKLKVFVTISIAILILSMGTPFTIPESPMPFTVSLLIMHLIAGVVTITVASVNKSNSAK